MGRLSHRRCFDWFATGTISNGAMTASTFVTVPLTRGTMPPGRSIVFDSGKTYRSKRMTS